MRVEIRNDYAVDYPLWMDGEHLSDNPQELLTRLGLPLDLLERLREWQGEWETNTTAGAWGTIARRHHRQQGFELAQKANDRARSDVSFEFVP